MLKKCRGIGYLIHFSQGVHSPCKSFFLYEVFITIAIINIYSLYKYNNTSTFFRFMVATFLVPLVQVV